MQNNEEKSVVRIIFNLINKILKNVSYNRYTHISKSMVYTLNMPVRTLLKSYI